MSKKPEEQVDPAVSDAPVGRTTEWIKPVVSLVPGGLSKVARGIQDHIIYFLYGNLKIKMMQNLSIF